MVVQHIFLGAHKSNKSNSQAFHGIIFSFGQLIKFHKL